MLRSLRRGWREFRGVSKAQTEATGEVQRAVKSLRAVAVASVDERFTVKSSFCRMYFNAAVDRERYKSMTFKLKQAHVNLHPCSAALLKKRP